MVKDYYSNDNYTYNNFLYSLKPSLITETEKAYLDAVRNCLPQGYFLQPQVNLASIITRNDGAKFMNELFRNVDACIFDMNFKPILIIEINDETHNQSSRRARDKKVANICEEAGIGIVTFWTKYGVRQDYISKTVNEGIMKAPYFVRVAHPKTTKPESAYDDMQTRQSVPVQTQQNQNNVKKGCYIATAVYGSYDCPNVWVLRRFRDDFLQKFWLGRRFIGLYYYFSPKLVEHFGDKQRFRDFCKCKLDAFVHFLRIKGYSDTPYND